MIIRFFSMNKSLFNIALTGALLLLLGSTVAVKAQQSRDTANQVTITIQHADFLERVTADTANSIMKLIGNVALKQGDNQLFCDSAYLDLDKNYVEAFGNVRIVQPGSNVQSDYLRYTGNTKQAFLKGNVSLTNGKDNLWAEELNYNTGTKLATYAQGGTLQTENTSLSSNGGAYNLNTKDARFTGEVYVTDPQYSTQSEDLGYNTATKVVTFFGPSVVTNDKSELRTAAGTYDTRNEVAHFTSRSSIQNQEQYIEANRLDYNRITGEGLAVGEVVALDTVQKITLYSDRATYNEISRVLLATEQPVLKKASENDSLFIRADTFYSAPVTALAAIQPVPKDTLTASADTVKQAAAREKKSRKKRTADTAAALSVAPPQPADTSVPRFFIGYRHVRVFSDSLQARCDSISYSQADSVLRLMGDPVAWSRQSQITGDTILLFTDSSRVRRLYVPNNAFLAARSGPEKAELFDQVQGRTLEGFFNDSSELEHALVWPNAETIQFVTDDAKRYIGVSQAAGERIRIYFENGAIRHIVYEQDATQTLTPLPQADLPAMRLSRFKWREKERPKSRAELFE